MLLTLNGHMPIQYLAGRAASVLSQKFVGEVSPRSGRKKVAHGVPEYVIAPSPLSRSAGRGEGSFPQGWRPGLSRLAGPLPGLRNGYPKREDFVSLL